MPYFSQFASWILLAQAEGEGAAGGGDGAAGGGGFFGGLSPLTFLPIIAIVVLYYFMLIKPDKKKRADAAEMLNNLKKNDRVETIGGICGTIANVQKDAKYVTLKIDESSNAKLKILRSAILRVVTEDEPADAGENA